MAISDNYFRMRDILANSGWVILQPNEDAYRKTGRAPKGIARVLDNHKDALLILEERVIGRFSCLDSNERRGIKQLVENEAQKWSDGIGRKAYFYDGKLPFVYILKKDELWQIDRIASNHPVLAQTLFRPEEMARAVKELAGDSRTFLHPTTKRFIPPATCKCSSGWVTTKHGGVFDASDSDRCRDCRELGRFEESQLTW